VLVRTWLGVGGSDAHGLLTALRELERPSDASGWSDLVLLVEAPAAPELLAHLPAALKQAAPPGWPSALPAGFHPLCLGPLHVLLCVGPVPQSLGELVCQAHATWISHQALPHHQTGEADGAKAVDRNLQDLPKTLSRLARCCAKQAPLTIAPATWSTEQAACLKTAGFIPLDATRAHWAYQPPWSVPSTPSPPDAGRHAMVVGAGLAGAAITWALVRRGWRVHLLDTHCAPALGASGLPVGLMTEHQANNDTVLSALSRVGVPLHLRELTERVPPGQGWQTTTVANLKDVPPNQQPPLEHLLTHPIHASNLQPGALVRPAALVNAWLSAARATGLLTETWGQRIEAIQPAPPSHGTEAGWMVQSANLQTVMQAPFLVLASAYGTQALLEPHSPPAALPLRPVKGQLTHAARVEEPWAPCPIRQQGVWVPAYADSGLSPPTMWAMGSTYERGQNDTICTPSSRAANLRSLQAMSPQAHDAVTQHAMQDWAGVRCASPDRLPLAGPWPAMGHAWNASDRLEHLPRQPGLWTVCALGSRGLTLAALLGEWVAAQMSGAPWPIARSHALALDPARFALRHARKSG